MVSNLQYGVPYEGPKFSLNEKVVYKESVVSIKYPSKTAFVEHELVVLGVRFAGIGKSKTIVGYQYCFSFSCKSIQELPARDEFWVDEGSLRSVVDGKNR